MDMADLDANATTPLDPSVLEAMRPYLEGFHGNPSSIHAGGRAARAAIDSSREVLADLLGARPHEIIFTSGGTESCNLAILGLARAHRSKGNHLVTSPTEHHAVLHAIEHLQFHEGWEVTLLPVDSDGRVDPGAFEAALRPDTVLASIMHANNETGTIQPIPELAATAQEHGVFFHTDAIQSFGKLPVSANIPGITAISLAAHKFYGPKGVGALWLKAGVALTRTAHGGSQENSRRPGTENTPAIVGLAAAASLAESLRESESARLAPVRDALWHQLTALGIPLIRNTPLDGSLANTLNISIPGCDGESLLMALDLEGIHASSGSACMVGSLQPSHVLLAMGRGHEASASAVRFSFGRSNTPDDATAAARAVSIAVSRQNRKHAA
ncbi:MAG: cysteine desulfurase NifS [Terrimicrobiaceae bacterium]